MKLDFITQTIDAQILYFKKLATAQIIYNNRKVYLQGQFLKELLWF